MNKDIDFDVIIPAYNCAEYLGRLIKQILDFNSAPIKQETGVEFSPKRIIVVDDCSDDDGDTAGVAKMTGVTYLKAKEHSGPLPAMLVGVEYSQSEFFVYCDSDISFCDDDIHSVERNGDVVYDLVYRLHRSEVYGQEYVSAVMPVILTEETKDRVFRRSLKRRRGPSQSFVSDERSVFSIGIRFNKYSITSTPDYINFDWGPLSGAHLQEWKPVMSVGYCYAIKREHYESVGGYDPVYGHGYREFHDDLMLKLRASGKKLRSTSLNEAYHPISKPVKSPNDFTRHSASFEEAHKVFKDRWEKNPLIERESVDHEEIINIVSKRDLDVGSGYQTIM